MYKALDCLPEINGFLSSLSSIQFQFHFLSDYISTPISWHWNHSLYGVTQEYVPFHSPKHVQAWLTPLFFSKGTEWMESRHYPRRTRSPIPLRLPNSHRTQGTAFREAQSEWTCSCSRGFEYWGYVVWGETTSHNSRISDKKRKRLIETEQSGAIIEYVVETYDKDKRLDYTTSPEKFLLKSWLHFQMSGQGPYFGQLGWYALFIARPPYLLFLLLLNTKYTPMSWL